MKYIFLILTGWLIMSCATSRFYNLEPKEFADFDYGFDIKYLDIHDIRVAMIDEGTSDDVIILIHGLGSNAKGWIKNIPALSKNYRVIALDLPGYGKSQKGYYKFTMEFYADILAGLIKQINTKTVTLAGHSMGGQIALTTALKYPDAINKLVLISPAGIEKFSEGEAAWFKKAVKPEFVEDTPIRNIDINLKSNFYEYPRDAEFMITERIQMKGAEGFDLYCYAVSENVAAMVDGPVYDKLPDITQPTLVLFGENDGLIPNPYLHGGNTADIGEIAKERIPNSTLVMVRECGHFVQFEKAETTNEKILSFLKQ